MSSSTGVEINKHSISAFYISGALREVIPIYPLYAIMFGQHGVTPFELSLLFSVWAIVGLIMEVPSGALADRFSRKWLIVVSGLLKSLAFLTWYFAQHFYGYMLGFVLWGLGSTLRSGAWEALLYDLLNSANQATRFTHHYGRIGALATAGVVLGELAGGFLIIRGFDFVLLISAAIPVLATIPFVVMVADPPSRMVGGNLPYFALLRQGVNEAVSNRKILYILLATAGLLTTLDVYDEFLAPVFFEHGFSLQLVAYLAAPMYLAQSLGQGLAGRFSGISLPRMLMLMACASLFMLAVTVVEVFWVPVMLSVYFFTFGLSRTLFEARLQREITGQARATVTSTVSLGDGSGAILWFLIFGFSAQQTSMIAASGIFALIILFICLAFLLLARRWGITH